MNIKSISKRTLAYIVLKVSGTMGGGFVFGIEVWQAAAMAAFIGLMEVSEQVSRTYVENGYISADHESEIFGGIAREFNDSDDELR